MSSLRNAVKRVTHKERSQPQARAHLGILEKKKDYVVRAKDYHRKEDRIQSMRRKASNRNPDEFYFGMHKTQVQDGVHRKTEAARQELLQGEIGPDAVKIMKHQDLNYVRMQRQRDSKKIEKMKASLHLLGSSLNEQEEGTKALSQKKKHTIFVSTQEDAEQFDVAEHFQTLPELAGRSFNRPRIESLQKAVEPSKSINYYDEEEEEPTQLSEKQLAKRTKLARKTAKSVAKARAAAYGEMEARKKRVMEMGVAEAHLVTEKLVSSKGRKRKIKGAEDGKPAVYKWRRKRSS
jgi:U3 small nucleolar RNA-associated protein 11